MVDDREDIDIEALKQNSEFLDFLKQLEEEMRSENSITKGYQLLDATVLIDQNNVEKIEETFTFLVTRSLDKLTGKLVENQKFNLHDGEDAMSSRAIYEHAMQRFSEDDAKGAKELFLALHHTIDDVAIKEAMLIHAVAAMAGYSFDDFLEKLVDKDVDFSQENSYFIQSFTQPNDILLGMFARQVQEAKATLTKLEEYYK